MLRDKLPARMPARRGRRRLPGSTWLIAFLVATVALSLWLAYQALDAARSHRETAVAALRDYARIAAWQYARVANENIDDVFDQLFDDVPRRLRGSRAPSPVQVWYEVPDAVRRAGCDCPELHEPTFAFRVDLRRDRALAVPDTVSGETLTALVDTLGGTEEEGARRHGLLLVPAGQLLAVAAAVPYMVTEDGEGPAHAYGAVFPAADFGRLFQVWYERAQLLPPTITGDAPNDSLLHVAVRSMTDIPLFEAGHAFATTLIVGDTIHDEYGPLVVEASVRPDAAGRLVIGGLPTSRLPIILGLLLLTLGVAAAALLQIRRERQLARMRDDFISGVSHELRTPLAQIRMFAELQEAGKLRTSEERERAVSVINREAQRLTHLVENILRFSRLRRTGERRLVRERIELAATTAEILEAFRPLANGRRMVIEASVDEGLAVVAQRDAVNQVLVNLLDNAVKYGPPGQTIRLAAARRDGFARLVVDDQGPGVPTGDRARVWEPYLRLERELDSRVAGTGIGLAVVAQLADSNGGRAWVEDAPAGGARFIVELPAAPLSSAPPIAEEEEVPA
jgi:signal transduction histidine kinase